MTGAEKTTLLFQYIKELSSLKNKPAKNVTTQHWYKYVQDIPMHQTYVSFTPSEEVLLKVEKPELQPCPQPSEQLREWLELGWGRFAKTITVIDRKRLDASGAVAEGEGQISLDIDSYTKEIPCLFDEAQQPRYAYFKDDQARVDEYETWVEKRNVWAEEQKIRYAIQQLFKDLHRLYMVLERDSETLEFVAGNGTIRDKRDRDLRYPVVTKRIKLNFNATANIVEICDTDAAPQLDTMLLAGMDDICYEEIKTVSDLLNMQAYHPFDTEDIPQFLKHVAHSISSDSKFIEATAGDKTINERITISDAPVLLVRKRMDGTQRAVENIIDNISHTGYVPPHLVEIVDGGKREIEEDTTEQNLEQKLAAVGGEDVDILLSKEANREQLEIAQRISKFNAVLVQGPPGTGKTHTIANLLGHFLAEGKSVLVTSHTKKALSVLKEKVSPDIQDLCVSILDDSNSDMERSIDGISDMLSRYTNHALQDKIERASEDRMAIIRELAQVRKKIHQIKFSEFASTVYCGESISPTEMAKFVHEHESEASYIPGVVALNIPLPLTRDQLVSLYESNLSLTSEEESELIVGIPDPKCILSPVEFSSLVDELEQLTSLQTQNLISGGCLLTRQSQGNLHFKFSQTEIDCLKPNEVWIQSAKTLSEALPSGEAWQMNILADGKIGGSQIRIWEQLMTSVEQVAQYAEEVMEPLFGHTVTFAEDVSVELLAEQLPLIESLYQTKSKIGFLDRLKNQNIAIVEQAVQVDGSGLKSAQVCALAIKQLGLDMKRRDCAVYWNRLMAVHGLPVFEELQADTPEQIAIKFLPEIRRYLYWYTQEFPKLDGHLQEMGIHLAQFANITPLDTAQVEVNKIMGVCQTTLKTILDALEYECKIQNKTVQLTTLYEGDFAQQTSHICRTIFEAYKLQDKQKYATYYQLMYDLYEKYSLRENRANCLKILRGVAPDWASAILNRVGIHGEGAVPQDIEIAWRWKQYVGMLDELTKEPFEELQKKSVALSTDYRVKTALVAKWRAWSHLKRRIEHDLDTKAALNGWKLTVKKIGKGTGKLAPVYRAEARKLMAKCQEAVPAWIMPMSKALENFVPGVNDFDIVIVDEASQSDISALAITYMAKKVIIVGDDKQVSPLSIGLDVTKMNQLATGTIKEIIPNWQLYTGNTSVYDIVSTVYTALMLKEHFRCVPDIIGYSNWLSYEYKIKPLRDTSDCTLLPAVVNYRVDGIRHSFRKINEVEANTIVALIQACMGMDEYKNKTFGVISMLGEEQAKRIEQLIFEHIDTVEIERHNILCGTSAQFQGDERDVVFLSLVDSNTKSGPMSMTSEGVDQATKKRYNVAVSRARDQLWVVHSMDVGRDLKQGDIRRGLLEYTANPKGYAQLAEEVAHRAESPFEEAVGKAIVSRGYQLVQQWPVGAYRIDMVVVDGDKKIAVECDGERWHSGEEKLREDMERQTILERLGWRFIRIRGSAYYRNPEAAMAEVFHELNEYGLEPTLNVAPAAEESSDLLQAIKIKAVEILSGRSKEDIHPSEIASYALNTTDEKIVPSTPVKPSVKQPSIPSSPTIKLESKTVAPISQPVRNGQKTYVTSKQYGKGEIIKRERNDAGAMYITVKFETCEKKFDEKIAFKNRALERV